MSQIKHHWHTSRNT